jgi:putative ABC transport system permease protein
VIEEKQRAGVPPEEATRAARIELGGITQVKELVRESHWGAWIDPLLQDVRYGLRILGRSRGFSAATILTLALGIGANTALFSVTRAFLLRDLPYRDPDRLVNVYEIWPHEPPFQASGARSVSPDFVNWRARGRSTNGMEAWACGSPINLTGIGEPERVDSCRITLGFFGLLGVQPILGRSFTRQEDQLGGPPAAMLSYQLWQRRSGGSPGVIGKAVTLDAAQFTIVGVLPASFVLPDNAVSAEIFVPMALPPGEGWNDPNSAIRIIRVLARLKPGITPAALEAECRDIVRSAASEEPPGFRTMRQGMQILVAPLRERLAGSVRPLLLVLEAAVIMVLLIGCLNIANLQIARALFRQKEMALRAALGAARGRLARQLLTESLVLSFMGGGAGLVLGLATFSYVRAALPANLHLAATIRMDAAVLAFTLGLAVLSGIVTGLAPSLAFSAERLEEVLRHATSRASESRQQHRLRSALVVAEIGVAMVLLAGAGLLTRSFLRLATVGLGFDPHGVLTVRIPLPERKYAKAAARVAFFAQMLEQARTIPGVQDAAFGSGLPLIGSREGIGTVVDGRPLPPIGGAPTISTTTVSPDYFQTLRIPLLRGRMFTGADRSGAPLVLIVNQAFADQFFPGEEALGKRLRFSGVRPGPPREIVGIVGNVRQQGLQKAGLPNMYVPFGQMADPEALLILRSSLPPAGLTAEAKRVIQGIDPDQPVADIATMEERVHTALAEQRTNMILMGIFAGLALTLAGVGIFGVIAYLVSRRSHEIGIRLALGAQQSDVLGLVFRQAIKLTAVGIGVGLGGALLGTRMLRNLLYETKPYDPATMAAAAALFAIIALAAVYWPARQASRLDPVVTLRHE